MTQINELSGDTIRIGPYRVERRIGQGGMGTVYLATRADEQFRKNVAIKVTSQGMDREEIIGRFLRERQILANLDHPNIARLMDGGTTDDGRPYFVMEYIDGLPIEDYCDNHKLSVPERLKLFRTVCSAVHYAHQNLVIHRDLKPGNILVTADGVPKLLDFGLAKVLNPELFASTAVPKTTGIGLMTPQYASPEQARGEQITTATDVYSLGVILYELLTGHRIFEPSTWNIIDVLEAISDHQPEKPSSIVTRKKPGLEGLQSSPEKVGALRQSNPERLRRQLRGDLDNIVLMTLRKEPQLRYASAEALSEDIRRFLDGVPVQARKSTTAYRAGKFIRLHKIGVAAAAAFAFLLIAFAVTMVFQARKIALERDKAMQISSFLTQIFRTSDPRQTRGDTITAREVLDQGAARIFSEFKKQPDVRASLMDTIGTVYESMGLFDKAQTLLQQSLDIREKLYGKNHLDVAESQSHLAHVFYEKGDYDKAETVYRQALALHQKLLGKENLITASDLIWLGDTLSENGKYPEAEKLARESVAIRKKLLGSGHPEVAKALNILGTILLWGKADYNTAEPMFREALAIDRKALGEIHPDVAVVLDNLGVLLWKRGQLAEAESSIWEALAIDRKVLKDDHPDVAGVLNDLAGVLRDKGDYPTAISLLRQSLAINHKALGNDQPQVAMNMSNLGLLLQEYGEYTESEKLMRDALAIDRKVFGNDHPNVAADMKNLALLLHDKGQYASAEQLYRQAITIIQKSLGNDHPDQTASLLGLGDLLIDTNRAKEAPPYIQKAILLWTKNSPDNANIENGKSILGKCFASLGRMQEAEKLLIDSYEKLHSNNPRDRRTRQCLQRLIDFYEHSGNKQKAEQYLQRNRKDAF